MDPDGVIGNGNAIPWYIPDDFKWFKEATAKGTLLMGRKTFESIGKPLPGRTTWCLTKSETILCDSPRYLQFRTILDLPRTDTPVWLCGGANLYEQLLPMCSEVFISKIKKRYQGNIHFPEYLMDRFKLIGVVRSHEDFTVLRYSNSRLTFYLPN